MIEMKEIEKMFEEKGGEGRLNSSFSTAKALEIRDCSKQTNSIYHDKKRTEIRKKFHRECRTNILVVTDDVNTLGA